ncbi:hypothetical protein BG74_07705 [Sodalis-like endosymbiont of Proechinophthirus fluctus]|nr:hypothetical protein BG74_07705 [Sodalis-like endosymbiont of Proechinophthirus fluctus]
MSGRGPTAVLGCLKLVAEFSAGHDDHLSRYHRGRWRRWRITGSHGNEFQKIMAAANLSLLSTPVRTLTVPLPALLELDYARGNPGCAAGIDVGRGREALVQRRSCLLGMHGSWREMNFYHRR